MKKKVSLKDIAQQVGVSTALVSYVLTGKEKQGRVGKHMADVIRKTARELNYQPNQLAKSLKTGRSYTIGLIVADISNPFFANIARHIEDEAKKGNYTAIFGSSDENAKKSNDLLEVLITRQVDGFIIAPAEHSEDQILHLKSLGIPFVLIDRWIPEVETNYVCIDNYRAAYEATGHLLNKGYTDVVMVAYNSGLAHMQERIRGFSAALRNHGLLCDDQSVVRVDVDCPIEDLEQTMDTLFNSGKRIEAVFFATNTLSVNGLKHLNKRNFHIPDDLAVVCFDESDSFDFFYCPVTYIKQPLTDIAEKAVQLLISQIEDRNADLEQIVYPAQLIVRKSCGKGKKVI